MILVIWICSRTTQILAIFSVFSYDSFTRTSPVGLTRRWDELPRLPRLFWDRLQSWSFGCGLVGQGETGGFFIWKLLPNWWVFQGSGYWATKGVEKLVSCTNSWIPSRKWCVLWGSRHWENLWIHHQHQFVSPILLWHDFRLYVRCPNGAWSWARREDLYNISL